MKNKKLYDVYCSMKQRCTNPKSSSYKNYGGRGVYVSDRWMESFDNFYEDMGDCPDGMTLERVDNDGPYSKENCIWATKLEQARNKRKTVNITHNGETRCLSDWAKSNGLTASCLKNRLKSGWPMDKALSTPPDAAASIRNRKIHKHNTTGIKGVSYVKRTGKYSSRITISGKVHHLGQFLSPNDAGDAYQMALRNYNQSCVAACSMKCTEVPK